MKGLFFVVLIVLLSACSGAREGAEYVGEWQHAKWQSDKLLISKHEEGFVVKRVVVSPLSGERVVQTIPARYENRSLMAMPLAAIVHDAENDTLSLGISTYQRVK